MATKVKPIPDGYHSLTPDLVVNDVSKAIEFYGKAFDAKEIFRFEGEDGKVLHAEIQIGDSRLMLCSERAERGSLSPSSLNGNTGALYLYVKDVDSTFNQAVKAGCKVIQGISDMFWGDRCGELVDLSGHRWMVATHVMDVTHSEMKKGAEAFFATMAKSK